MIEQKWVDRFNAKWVKDSSGCWIWKAAHVPKGYGFIKIPNSRKYEFAHRLSYRIHVGEIPEGAHVLHRCDVPACVNPLHLFLGDCHENHLDMVAKGRSTLGERNAKAILTAVEVRQIKALLELGDLSQLKIGRLFGVSQIEISRISRGLRWAHIK